MAALGLAATLAACAESGGGGGPSQSVFIAMSDAGCEPDDVVVREGRVTFTISNPRSSSVTSFDIVQGGASKLNVTNVLGGLTRNATVGLDEGSYTMRCMKGGIGGTGTITVTE
jgi:hypothetical protein